MAEAVLLTSSHVVDARANAMLASAAWNDILDALARVCLSVYLTSGRSSSAERPMAWLDHREALSALALSLSSTPLSPSELRAVATQLAKVHGFGDAACQAWARSEAKWLLGALTQAPTPMAGFMALPQQIQQHPGVVAPLPHSHAGHSMRTAMAHACFEVVAGLRRVQAIEPVGALDGDEDFDVLPDGSVTLKPGRQRPPAHGTPAAATAATAATIAIAAPATTTDAVVADIETATAALAAAAIKEAPKM